MGRARRAPRNVTRLRAAVVRPAIDAGLSTRARGALVAHAELVLCVVHEISHFPLRSVRFHRHVSLAFGPFHVQANLLNHRLGGPRPQVQGRPSQVRSSPLQPHLECLHRRWEDSLLNCHVERVTDTTDNLLLPRAEQSQLEGTDVLAVGPAGGRCSQHRRWRQLHAAVHQQPAVVRVPRQVGPQARVHGREGRLAQVEAAAPRTCPAHASGHQANEGSFSESCQGHRPRQKITTVLEHTVLGGHEVRLAIEPVSYDHGLAGVAARGGHGEDVPDVREQRPGPDLGLRELHRRVGRAATAPALLHGIGDSCLGGSLVVAPATFLQVLSKPCRTGPRPVARDTAAPEPVEAGPQLCLGRQLGHRLRGLDEGLAGQASVPFPEPLLLQCSDAQGAVETVHGLRSHVPAQLQGQALHRGLPRRGRQHRGAALPDAVGPGDVLGGEIQRLALAVALVEARAVPGLRSPNLSMAVLQLEVARRLNEGGTRWGGHGELAADLPEVDVLVPVHVQEVQQDLSNPGHIDARDAHGHAGLVGSH
mmetsp:Transcript_159793/g.512772  ORF Transcript_159793/g.512772 Transcript_159793/m.512772 type:complete len:535 (-) Transcript_159793:1214-2818(-)